MKTELSDDVNYKHLVMAVNRLTDEQCKLIIETVIASYEWRSLWKPVEFDANMVYVLSTILAWYKPAWLYDSF